jgi:hypothetical protein
MLCRVLFETAIPSAAQKPQIPPLGLKSSVGMTIPEGYGFSVGMTIPEGYGFSVGMTILEGLRILGRDDNF